MILCCGIIYNLCYEKKKKKKNPWKFESWENPDKIFFAVLWFYATHSEEPSIHRFGLVLGSLNGERRYNAVSSSKMEVKLELSELQPLYYSMCL